MNAFLRTTGLFVVSCIVVALPTRATNVGTGLIHQPTFLGEASQPWRIPLAPVIYNANYNYGSHAAIFQSRPCYHGHFTVQDGTCYEQNLAALYGVSADFSDPTQLQGSTVTIRLGKASPPANSPYTLEQVVAASIQCILDSAGGLKRNSALTVEIEGKGIPTPEWVSKYAKAYFSEAAPDERNPAITLPGLKIEETPLGVRYIVFEDVSPRPSAIPREPVFVPFLPEGECDADAVLLIPVWPGDEWSERLNVLALPYLPYYEKWHSRPSGRTTEPVAIPHLAPPNPVFRNGGFNVDRSDEGVQVTVTQTGLGPAHLAAVIFSWVVSERPTLDRPMTVGISPQSLPREYRDRLKADSSWDDGLSCKFALDPAGLNLLKGSVPGYELKRINGTLVVSRSEDPRPDREEDAMPAWIADALAYIRDEAPAVDQGMLADIKDRPDLFRNTPPADDIESAESMIFWLLVVWKFDASPTLLENVWFSSNNRCMRALAAALLPEKRQTAGDDPDDRFNLEAECRRFEPWEAARRLEEGNYHVAQAIHKALKVWEARVAAPDQPADR